MKISSIVQKASQIDMALPVTLGPLNNMGMYHKSTSLVTSTLLLHNRVNALLTYFKRGSIYVWLTSCLTGLDYAKSNIIKAAETQQVKQEVSCTLTLSVTKADQSLLQSSCFKVCSD